MLPRPEVLGRVFRKPRKAAESMTTRQNFEPGRRTTDAGGISRPHFDPRSWRPMARPGSARQILESAGSRGDTDERCAGRSAGCEARCAGWSAECRNSATTVGVLGSPVGLLEPSPPLKQRRQDETNRSQGTHARCRWDRDQDTSARTPGPNRTKNAPGPGNPRCPPERGPRRKRRRKRRTGPVLGAMTRAGSESWTAGHSTERVQAEFVSGSGTSVQGVVSTS
jgi:hypothetical protein